MLTPKNTPTCSTLLLTEELAQEIYTAIKDNNWSWQKAFTNPNTDFDFSNCKAVSSLIQAVENEISQKMSGAYIITPAVPPVLDPETSEVIEKGKPAEYFVPSTQEALVASIESLLDVSQVVSDILEVRGETWEDFKASFTVDPEGF